MRHPDGGTVDVELVDDSGDDAAESGQPAERRPTTWRSGAAVKVLAVLLVAGVAVGANLIERAQREQRRQAVAAMPHLVRSLAEPLGAQWTDAAGVGSVRILDLLLLSDAYTGEPTYRAVEVSTGDQRWEIPIGRGGVVDSCREGVEAEPAPVAVCWKDGERTGRDQPAEPTRMLGLSLADGSVVVEREMNEPDAGYGTVGSDIVLGTLEGQVLTVQRADLVSSEVRWVAELQLETPSADGSYEAAIRVQNGYVVVTGPTTVVLSDVDGRELARWQSQPPAQGAAARPQLAGADVRTTNRGFAAWDGVTSGSRSLRGSWYDADGRQVVSIYGLVVEPLITDGSDPQVLLLLYDAGGDLQGLDVESGQVIWSVPSRGGQVLMRRDGAVILSDGRRVVSLDLTSGLERWSTEVDGLRPEGGAVSDGLTVVVVAVQERTWMFHALDLETGAVRWTADAPREQVHSEFIFPGAGGVRLVEVEGYAVALGQRSVTGLG